ncbi:MAG TPA: hypothetical protein VEL07_22155 [Planctomycetota bacterium]|nr:hypothetical protein [Planctomycetota bacterium]
MRASSFAGEAAVTVVVTDDAGEPVPAATVVTGWSGPRADGDGAGAGASRKASALTDDVGVARLAVPAIPQIVVMKDGYYSNGLSSLIDTPRLFTAPIFAANDVRVSIALQRKLRPAPMYVRRVVARIPRQGAQVAFDMSVGDWVHPDGTGTNADLLVEMSMSYRGERDYDYICRIAFPNPHDGILLVPVRSRFRMNELRLPREAPLDGYVNEWSWNVVVGDGPAVHAKVGAQSTSGPAREFENDNFILRLRSETSPDGGLASAMYGKIHGEITPMILPHYPARAEDCYPAISFLVYLNPDRTRSLEWDTTQNLASGADVPLEP